MPDWAVGISTGCFCDTPLVDVLEPIRASGFHQLEICSLPSHLDFRDRDACERAARRIDELGLEPYSFHAPFADAIDITAPDAGRREHACTEIGRALEAAARLGTHYFVLHPGPESSDLPRGERLERMENAAASLDRVAGRCRELGMRLVLENMLPHLFSGHVRELLWLLGALAATDVGVCLDTGHAFLSGDLGSVAHKLSGHLWMVHASDTRGTYDDHLPPGDGVVPWDALMRQLHATNFDGAFVLEIASGGPVEEVLARARRGRSHLRRAAHAFKIGGP
jgi:sugar phosphate isomerase/epimerase